MPARLTGSSAAPHLQAVPAPLTLRLRLDGRSFGTTQVLGPMALDLAAGECVALVGASGVGKSTLLRIIAGIDTGFRGLRQAPGRVAMVFQEPVLLPWRTVRRNLTLTTSLDAAGAEAALAEVGLSGLGGRYPGQLSLGQQRRLALARAFGVAPDLLLLDEAFVSLDPETLVDIYALFEAMRAGRKIATVMVTHDATEAHRFADRILRLSGCPATLQPG